MGRNRDALEDGVRERGSGRESDRDARGSERDRSVRHLCETGLPKM